MAEKQLAPAKNRVFPLQGNPAGEAPDAVSDRWHDASKPSGKRVRAGKRIAIPEEIVIFIIQLIDFGSIIVAAGITEIVVDMARIDSAGMGIFRLGPTAACLLLGASHIVGAYDTDHLYVFREAVRRVVGAWLSATLFMIAVMVSTGLRHLLSIQVLSIWFVTGALMLAAGRCLFVGSAIWLRETGSFNHVVVIFGAGAQGIALAHHLRTNDTLSLSLIGLCDEEVPNENGLPVPYLGGINELVRLIRADIVDEVIIALPWSEEDRLRVVVERLTYTPVEVRLAPERLPLGDAQRQILFMAGLPLVALLHRPLTDMQRYLKAAEDRFLSFVALVVLSPLMAMIAIGIKIDSPGPILFRQPREGFNCRSFSVLKFRTMYADTCARENVTQVCKSDPRVTRLGAWLRRSSLDELPQLVNVLLGQMSLVGPRPHAPSTRAGGTLFAEVTASYARRHNVKPGLTGWAQVSGWRGETDTEEKLVNRLKHDLDYIERWSLGFDLYILIRTIWVVATGRGAY